MSPPEPSANARGDHPALLTVRCGAGNALALTQRFVYEDCTLPAGHAEWSVNPATGYSYNHCNVEADSWWNDPS